MFRECRAAIDMFNLLAIGPLLFCLFFGLNGLFTREARHYIVHRTRHAGFKETLARRVWFPMRSFRRREHVCW